MLRVRIGGLVFYGYDAGVPGFYIEPDGFTGWDSGTDVRRDETEIPQGHGSFDVPGFLTPRVPALKGFRLDRSQGDLDWAGSALTGLGAGGGIVKIIVENNGQTQWANGRLTGKTQFDQIGDDLFATYQIQFWCANPRKFGEARTFVSGEVAHHYGNFAATELITVTGSEPGGYTIYGPAGKQFIVTAPLVSGHPHTIDMSKGVGMLSIDGAYVMGGLGSRTDVWAIPAGGQVVATVSGSAALSRLVLDTFL